MRFNTYNIIHMWNRKGFRPTRMLKDLKAIKKYIDDDTLNRLLLYLYDASY